MKKSYYLTFGSLYSINELASLLNSKLDIEFTPRESSYIGYYLSYTGLYADKLTLEENFCQSTNEWREEQYKQYPVLIYLSNIQGRNSDKKSKSEYIKRCFLNIPDIALLKEQIVTE